VKSASNVLIKLVKVPITVFLVFVLALSAINYAYDMAVYGSQVITSIPISNGGILAYDSGKGEIFVANQGDNTVSVISDTTNRVIATISTGQTFGNKACALAYDSVKHEVFVAAYSTKTVCVISDDVNQVSANISVGSNPTRLAYNSGTGQVFVLNDNDSTASVISDSTNSVVATIPLGTPRSLGDIIYDSGKKEILIAESNAIFVIPDSSVVNSSPTPIVPEFPAITLLSLVASVSVIIAFKLRKTRR
jgi:YVTN family beta-propeller protein